MFFVDDSNGVFFEEDPTAGDDGDGGCGDFVPNLLLGFSLGLIFTIGLGEVGGDMFWFGPPCTCSSSFRSPVLQDYLLRLKFSD